MTKTTTPESRADGWFSALSGYGVNGRDKRQSVGYEADMLTDQAAMDLWRGDDLAARIVETVPNECLRQGYTINAGDKELSEALSAELEDLKDLGNLLDAKKFERAYGGGAIFPVINDSNGDLSQPLNEDRISKISHLIVFEPRELQPVSYYTDLNHAKFGLPSMYRLNPMTQGGMPVRMGTEVHETRLICFYGIAVSRSTIGPAGWGDSVLSRCHAVLRDFNISWASTSALLHDFAQAAFKIKGLAELIATDKDDIIKARLRAVELSRSTIRAIVMDSEEEFERKQTPVSGLSELLDRFATRLAAAADMPVTLLMGQSPAGLNATGESDIRFFYDRIKVVQKLGFKDQIERLVSLILRSIDGPTKGKEPDAWSVEFNPLWQPSAKEIADARKVVADTDVAYINAQVVSPEEVSLSRFGGDTYSPEMVIDFDEREKQTGEAEIAEPGEAGEAGEAVAGPGAVAPTGAENVAATAMNGAQVSSLIDLVVRTANGELSRESAVQIISKAYQMTVAEAMKVLGPEDFEPKKPDPPPNPFGGGGKATFPPKDPGLPKTDGGPGSNPKGKGLPVAGTPYSKKQLGDAARLAGERMFGSSSSGLVIDRIRTVKRQKLSVLIAEQQYVDEYEYVFFPSTGTGFDASSEYWANANEEWKDVDGRIYTAYADTVYITEVDVVLRM